MNVNSPVLKMYEPRAKLLQLEIESGFNIHHEDFAKYLDDNDPLKEYRNDYYMPKNSDVPFADLTLVNPEEACVYLCGHSLGLQPKETKKYIDDELHKWATKGVLGHAHVEDKPWLTIDETVNGLSAEIVGAKESEVIVMNTLTVNLHILMVPFYRPTLERHKILIEGGSFPSDYYAVESQIKFHGFDPSLSLVEALPRENESCLRTEDILKIIEEQGDSIALIMFSGIQYYTGQFFDMKAITEVGHKKGCCVGFDLAHAVGNVELSLHDWNVDFACWCTYKYLNAGPGAIGGVFVHEKHEQNFDLPRLAGWWGHDKPSRFQMEHKFIPLPGAAGFQLSNPPVFQTVSLLSSLQIHTKATMNALRKKSLLLTGYMEYLLTSITDQDNEGTSSGESSIKVITPRDPAGRGAQLSLLFPFNIEKFFTELGKRGVVVDQRKPNVIRVAAAPIYNSFLDVYKFYKYVKDCYNIVYREESRCSCINGIVVST